MDRPPQAGRYRVIYADPPWRFATYSNKVKGAQRRGPLRLPCLPMFAFVRKWGENWLQADMGAATRCGGLGPKGTLDMAYEDKGALAVTGF